MKNLALRCFAPFIVVALPLVAQTDPSQKVMKSSTGGSCSPIVNGGSSQITINCNGLSPAKANQLVTLMNRILAERMDLSEVNLKLDQVQSALGNINDTVTSAMDPFAKAPPPMLALLKQGDLLTTRCTSFGTDWSEKISTVTNDQMRQLHANLNSQSSSPAASPVGQQKAQEFSTTYGPRLVAMNAKFHTLMPDEPPIRDIGVPTSVMEASTYNLAIYMLSQSYEKQQRQAGRPVDTRLTMEERRLWKEVLDSLGAWNNEVVAGIQSQPSFRTRPKFALNLQSATDDVNAKEMQSYRQTLEPQLVSFRDAVLPHVPDYANGKDYDAVGTNMQMMGVCGDLNNLRLAYRTQAAEELKRGNAGKKR